MKLFDSNKKNVIESKQLDREKNAEMRLEKLTVLKSSLKTFSIKLLTTAPNKSTTPNSLSMMYVSTTPIARTVSARSVALSVNYSLFSPLSTSI